MMIFVYDKEENFVGKGENAGRKHFLLFPQCKGLLVPGCESLGLYGKGLKFVFFDLLHVKCFRTQHPGLENIFPQCFVPIQKNSLLQQS